MFLYSKNLRLIQLNSWLIFMLRLIWFFVYVIYYTRGIVHFFLKFNTARSLYALYMLKLSSFFIASLLFDMSVLDLLAERRRFKVHYGLLSSALVTRYSVMLELLNDQHTSITKLFLVADWLEREAFDMFGVYFIGHGNLRRILTDYIFVGYPLLRDFPVTGLYELFYNLLYNAFWHKSSTFGLNDDLKDDKDDVRVNI